jgi:membrane protein implicated in regulation of membrane protease activity
MGLDATARRRWLGALMLLTALGMLVAGETVLKNRLKDLAFLLYWLLCFAFTSLAIVMAYLDVRALQRRTRREAHELLQTTLKDIQTEARSKPRRMGKNDEQ